MQDQAQRPQHLQLPEMPQQSVSEAQDAIRPHMRCKMISTFLIILMMQTTYPTIFIKQSHSLRDSNKQLEREAIMDGLEQLEGALYCSQYHLVCLEDEFDPDKTEVEQQQFQVTTRLLKDLNFLLHMVDEKFWNDLIVQKQLEDIEPSRVYVKRFLNSCLKFLRIQHYNIPANTQLNTLFEHTNEQTDLLVCLWGQMKRLTLLTYCRISQIRNHPQADTVFNNWFLDSTKLLDICMNYGNSNPMIVKQIVLNVYNPRYPYSQSYVQDFGLCLDHASQFLLHTCDEMRDFELDIPNFDREAKGRGGLSSIQHSTVRGFMLILFKAYDCVLNLIAIYAYFPPNLKNELASRAMIFKRAIRLYCILWYQSRCKWKFGNLKQALSQICWSIAVAVIELIKHTLLTAEQCLIHESNRESSEEVKINVEKAVVNIFYFFAYPPLQYQDQDDRYMLDKFKRYCRDLLINVVRRGPKIQLFEGLLGRIDKQNQQAYKAVQNAVKFASVIINTVENNEKKRRESQRLKVEEVFQPEGKEKKQPVQKSQQQESSRVSTNSIKAAVPSKSTVSQIKQIETEVRVVKPVSNLSSSASKLGVPISQSEINEATTSKHRYDGSQTISLTEQSVSSLVSMRSSDKQSMEEKSSQMVSYSIHQNSLQKSEESQSKD